jgi:hypothetical protein
MRTVVELVLASAGRAGGFVGYLDYADGEPHWRQPKGERKLIELATSALWSSEYGGPPTGWSARSITSRRTLVPSPRDIRLRAVGLPRSRRTTMARGDRASVGRRAGR